MKLPPGFVDKSKLGKICQLKKSIYGLQKSLRAWFDRFSKHIIQQGYKQTQAGHTLFHRKKVDKVTSIIIYIDNIINRKRKVEIDRVKQSLAQEFEMKHLGPLRFFIGMETAKNSIGISITQQKYVLDLLKETKILAANRWKI